MSRTKLKFIIFGFLVCWFLNGKILAQTDTLSFLHITDLHLFFNPAGYHLKIIAHRNNKHYDLAQGYFRYFLENIPDSTKCNMIVATGDLIDFFNAETPNGNIRDLQTEQFCQFVEDYHIPLYLTLGNHEYFSYTWKEENLNHNQNSSGRARASWIRNNTCFKNGTYYSKVFPVGKMTYRLIFLDNGFYQFLPDDSTDIPYIDKSQLYWLIAQLNEVDDDIEIICMHIPFDESAGQDESSNELYSILTKHPSCKLILSGHYHKNRVSFYPSGKDTKLVQIQTGALVRGTENWRMIQLTENNILVSLPGQIENEVLIPVN